MKTAIVTDSNSGISKEEAKSLGIYMIPMPVIIDAATCYEGVNLTETYFYECLTGGREISTSQPSPGDVMEQWETLLDSGYDEIVHIPMSSGLSNSCQTAMGLSCEYDGKVQVVDNHRVSITMHISVLEALAMAKEGMSAVEIKQDLEKRAYDSSIYISVDTLEYLKKGGRVTAAGAALGAVLNIKPVLTIQGEKLDAYAKVRGMKKCKLKMIEALQHDLDTRFSHVELSRIRLGAAGTCLTKEEADEWKQLLSEAFPSLNVYYDPLSLSIGCHLGPKAYGCGISVVAEGKDI